MCGSTLLGQCMETFKRICKREHQHSAPHNWIPLFSFENDEMILHHVQPHVVHAGNKTLSTFMVDVEFAMKFGFVQQDLTTNAYSVGPNMFATYPDDEYSSSFPLHYLYTATQEQGISWYGKNVAYHATSDVDFTPPKNELF